MIQKFDDASLEVTLCKSYDDVFNNVNIGVAILSESKRIMNQLFDYCDSNDTIIVYSAVDSIMIESSKLELLKHLIGEKIGELKIVTQGIPIIINKGTYYLNASLYRCFGTPHKKIQPKVKQWFLRRLNRTFTVNCLKLNNKLNNNI
jgi:hypothetical protein